MKVDAFTSSNLKIIFLLYGAQIGRSPATEQLNFQKCWICDMSHELHICDSCDISHIQHIWKLSCIYNMCVPNSQYKVAILSSIVAHSWKLKHHNVICSIAQRTFEALANISSELKWDQQQQHKQRCCKIHYEEVGLKGIWFKIFSSNLSAAAAVADCHH